jgi:hypothetical protein
MVCGKAILVGHKRELDEFARKVVQKRPVAIHYGTDEFLPIQHNFALKPLDWGKSNTIKRRFQSFVQSGLLHRELAGGSKTPVHLGQIAHRTSGRPLRLSSNVIASIFVIFGAFLTLSLIFFGFEARASLMNREHAVIKEILRS